MLDIYRFFLDNIISIILVSIFIFAVLVIYSSINLVQDKKSIDNEKIKKSITVETYSDLNKSFNDILSKGDICNQEQLDNECSTLNNSHCKIASCCVLRKPEHPIVTTTPALECVAGNANGPTYHSIGDNPIHTEYYYHKGICYGKKCPDNR